MRQNNRCFGKVPKVWRHRSNNVYTIFVIVKLESAHQHRFKSGEVKRAFIALKTGIWHIKKQKCSQSEVCRYGNIQINVFKIKINFVFCELEQHTARYKHHAVDYT